MTSVSTTIRLQSALRRTVFQIKPRSFAHLASINTTSFSTFKLTNDIITPVRKCNLINCDNFKSCIHTSSFFHQISSKCVQCSYEYTTNVSDLVEVVTCPKCGSLQNVDSSTLPNYFEILGHAKTFKIDAQSISNNAKHLQKRFHPDLYSQKSQDQQNLSQEYSSLINKALSTLLDPIARGRYLLDLEGSPVADLKKTMTSDPEFLEEVMELNERLEEIVSENDWKIFRDENEETMKKIQEELIRAFEVQDLKEAQLLLARLKYYDSLQLRLKELQSRIGVIE